MTTQDMINTIRAGKRLGHRALAEIADRLEEQDSYLRSALATLQEQAQLVTEQEQQLRGLGGELAESEQHRNILTTQNAELLARCDLLDAESTILRDGLQSVSQRLTSLLPATSQEATA